jgi:ABC-type antimicrobial peptide transport system permease subunit
MAAKHVPHCLAAENQRRSDDHGRHDHAEVENVRDVISDSRRSPSWSNMAFTVPWATLAGIFLIVYAVALATTFVPARRASRIYPAEAHRYQ